MKIIPFSIAIVIIVLYAVMSTNPLRRSPERIREYLLELTPIGMTLDEAERAIRGHNIDWWVVHVSGRMGAGMVGVDMSRAGGRVGEFTGEKSIRASLGGYRGGFMWTLVEANWAFDGNAELIDVFVWKFPNFNNPNHLGQN